MSDLDQFFQTRPGRPRDFDRAALHKDPVFPSQRDDVRDCAQRDKINEQVMKDPRIAGLDMKAMPFDPKRMFFGGFEVLVAL